MTCNMIFIGAGGIARHHLRAMLKLGRATRVVGIVEPDAANRAAFAAIFAEAGRAAPPAYETLPALLDAGPKPDAAFICSPHKFHCEQIVACLRAGIDVLVEKPMVLNAAEARRVIRERDRSGRLLVVAFNGSLSPAIRRAKEMIAAGKLGDVRAVSVWVHQHWKDATTGTWRQEPDVSGGGFLFDTGSHMINTLVDVLGDDVAEVCALQDARGAPVEIDTTVTGRTRGGVLFSFTAAGDSIHCTSELNVFGTKGVLRSGIWGERLDYKPAVQKDNQREWSPVKLPASRGVWRQFLDVRAGRIPNPSPAEIGLRFALLMDLIRKSVASGRVERAGRR
jgi:predicted dehydrogenase